MLLIGVLYYYNSIYIRFLRFVFAEALGQIAPPAGSARLGASAEASRKIG